MSTVSEIEAAIITLPLTEREEIRRWINEDAALKQTVIGKRKIPDFLRRQKQIFGDRILPSSQETFDILRTDPF